MSKKPNARILRSWRERADTIRRKSDDLMVEMMAWETAPVGDAPMTLSDWADNIRHNAEELIQAIERMRK